MKHKFSGSQTTMRIALLFIFAALSASAQTNSVTATNRPETFPTLAQRYDQARMECIQSRRSICGKIVKILPEGLVVESGYTDLQRSPINRSWLIPGTATATRPANLVEAVQPGAICVGLVFVTDLPKSRSTRPRPKLYDYVDIEGFPVGQYTYASIGGIQRTVREFTTKLQNATQWRLDQSATTNAPPQ